MHKRRVFLLALLLAALWLSNPTGAFTQGLPPQAVLGSAQQPFTQDLAPQTALGSGFTFQYIPFLLKSLHG